MTETDPAAIVNFIKNQMDMWRTIASYCPDNSPAAVEDQATAERFRRAIELIESAHRNA